MEYIKGKLTYSKQHGTPGHCSAAQVFDAEKSIAVIDATEDENDATETARLFHAAPDMLDVLIKIVNHDRGACEDAKELYDMVGDMISISLEVIKKAKNI